ncbi:MAG TPA: hypothetical protein VFF15_08425 [Flavobacteriaceae bacterium]|nr:hypothetical protein [Flavobacteriaceae bacterium]
MKNCVKKGIALLFIAVYVLAASSFVAVSQGTGTTEKHTQKQDTAFSSGMAKGLGYIPQQETLANSLENLPAGNEFHSLSQGLLQNACIHEQVQRKQCTQTLQNARIQYRKSDLIFPFHYFW